MNDRRKPQNFQNKLNTQQRCVNFVNHLDRIRVLAILCPVKSKVTNTPAQTPRVHASRHKHTHDRKPHTDGHRRGRRTPGRSGGEPQTGPHPRGANNHAPPPAADPSQEWQGAAARALSQEWRGTPTTTGGATRPRVAGKHTQKPPPGVARDRPHTSHTPTHTNTSSKPQPGKQTATRRHTRANTHRRHTHTHTIATNTQHTHEHAPRHKHTQHGKPPPNPAETATTAASGPKQGMAGNRAQDPQPGVANSHPPPTPADPQRGVGGDRTRGPQPGAARERPRRTHSRKRGTTPSKPADLSQEWRRPTPHQHQGTPARSRGEPHPGPPARSGDGPPTTNTSGPPARSGRGPQPGPSARSGEGTPANPEPTAGSEGPRPANRRTSARSGQGPPYTNTRRPSARRGRGVPDATGGEPQPGEAGTRTQATRPGKAKSPPLTTATPPGRDGKPTSTNHAAKRGGWTKGAHEGCRRGTQPQGFWGPPADRISPT